MGNMHTSTMRRAGRVGAVLAIVLVSGPVATAGATRHRRPTAVPATRVAFHAFSLGGGQTLDGEAADQPWDITRGADGNMWFAEDNYSGYDFSGSVIGRVTPSGLITRFPVPSQGVLQGVAEGYDGNVWFTEGAQSGAYVGRITPSGQITEFPVTDALNIARGPDDEMWFSADEFVGRIDENGNSTIYQLPPPREAHDLVEGPDGNLWFTVIWNVDSPAWDEIGRITPTGTVTLFRIPHFNAIPTGITVGPDHNIWFGEHGGRIGRITSSGKITEFPLKSSNGPIVSGPGGKLWFLDAGRHEIGRITTSGKITEFRVPGITEGPAFGLGVGDGRTLWFTQTYGGAVYRATIAHP